jgi:acyl-CoA synthetase (NDP forming)/GNAT superfamily N-acetyltransferase
MTISTAPAARAASRPAPVEALLSDGSVVIVRPVLAADVAGLTRLHRQGSARSNRSRFNTTSRTVADAYARHLGGAAGPGGPALALVAEREGEIVAVASAEPAASAASAASTASIRPGGDGSEAEVALFVAEHLHRTGLGTLLLEHLAGAARAAGLHRFTALVGTGNSDMFDVFAHAGFEVTYERAAAGQVVVHLELAAGPVLTTALAERERRAVAASVGAILRPGSVVVVGAGRGPGGVGRAVVGNLIDRHFHGPVAAVNPNVVPGEMINGGRSYRSIADIPWRPDLAVIAVPAVAVPAVLHECGAKGVRAVVVLSSGFAEAGRPAAQTELVRIAHRYGMRLVGPNCLGVLNTDPEVRLDATFARSAPRAMEHGGVGIAAQSGALGIAVLDAAQQRGTGVSSFVSLGNKADVSGNDMLLYWAQDPRTDVAALYLESIGNPRRFRRIAAEVSHTLPIVALRSGRSAAGARAGASHTAAAATPDASIRALFHDSGVIAAETTEELVDIAELLATQPVPAGRRLVVVGNGGGPGALATDSAFDAGAVLPELTPATVARLQAVLGTAASLQNPVDLGATAGGADYAAAIEILRTSGEADALVIIHVATAAHPTGTVIKDIEQAHLDALRTAPGGPPAPAVTMAAVLIGSPAPRNGVLPWYGLAEPAARAVARAAGLGEWRARHRRTTRSRPAGRLDTDMDVDVDTNMDTDVDTGVDGDAVRSFLADCPRSDEGWLAPDAVTRLLDLVGIPFCATRVVDGVDAAVEAAVAVDGPVVVKSALTGLTHKSDVGAVVVGVRGADEVARAAARVVTATGSQELLIQPLVPAGHELLVGLSTPGGGIPVVMIAAGGIHEDVLDDRALGTLPLAPGAASDLVGRLRCSPLLTGHRGSRPLDRAAVVDVLERVALLDLIAPQIRELDINPLVVGERGVVAVDAKVRVAVPTEAARRPDPVADDHQRRLA